MKKRSLPRRNRKKDSSSITLDKKLQLEREAFYREIDNESVDDAVETLQNIYKSGDNDE